MLPKAVCRRVVDSQDASDSRLKAAAGSILKRLLRAGQQIGTRASVYPRRWHRRAQARSASTLRWGRPEQRTATCLPASVAITDARKLKRGSDRFDCAKMKSVDALD